MSIRLEHVNYIYGIGSGYEKQALRDVSLEIHDGEFIGVAGHTGSGKSTLAQLFNGLEKPTSGTIYYNEKDISEKSFSLRELRSKVGLVFQYPEHQLFEISVIQDVEFGPKNLGLKGLEVERRSFQALKMVGIHDDLLDVSPHTLSGGQKRRVAIAGVLAMEPEVLVLDEPTAGLDPQGRKEILDLLQRLHREQHKTIVLISHSMEDVADYAQRLLVMNQGKLVLDGTPQSIFQYEKELGQIGLGVPQATRVLRMLREAGADMDSQEVTSEGAVESIAAWLGRKGVPQIQERRRGGEP